MFREEPVGKWMGPYRVADRKQKLMILNTGDHLFPASVDSVKLYRDSIPPGRTAFGNSSDVHP